MNSGHVDNVGVISPIGQNLCVLGWLGGFSQWSQLVNSAAAYNGYSDDITGCNGSIEQSRIIVPWDSGVISQTVYWH